MNPIVRGWITYYGRFCKSELVSVLRGLNGYLLRWATQKFKRYRRRRARAWDRLGEIARLYPGLFAHWQFGVRP
uniref:group II intron maturase-specific domain-containing protein n=1 Tax=Gordonia sp. B7-2 TaxID=3420932 RepID=UPI003D8AA25A